MDDFLIDRYVSHALAQCQFIVWAYANLAASIAAIDAESRAGGPDHSLMAAELSAVRDRLVTPEMATAATPEDFPDERRRLRRAENRVLERYSASGVMMLPWYHVQQMLTAAANVCKVLYGADRNNPRNAKRVRERQGVRDALGVTDADTIWLDVSMRNNFDHFDERLEEWWDGDENHNLVDMMIGVSPVVSGANAGRRPVLRAYDPVSGDLTFWNQRFNVRELVGAAQKILNYTGTD